MKLTLSMELSIGSKSVIFIFWLLIYTLTERVLKALIRQWRMFSSIIISAKTLAFSLASSFVDVGDVRRSVSLDSDNADDKFVLLSPYLLYFSYHLPQTYHHNSFHGQAVSLGSINVDDIEHNFRHGSLGPSLVTRNAERYRQFFIDCIYLMWFSRVTEHNDMFGDNGEPVKRSFGASEHIFH